MPTIHFDLEDSKMRSCRKRVIIALAAICMFSGLTLASEQILQTGKTTNNVSIQPTDAVLFELPTGAETCAYDYCVHTVGETLRYPMDDYSCCYIDITVNLKICRLCVAQGYDLDYKMVPHVDSNGICEECGKFPFTPAVAMPLT